MLLEHLFDRLRHGRIRLVEDLKAHATAVQARLAVDLDTSVRAHHRHLRLPAREHGRGVAAQIALARRESPARGTHRFDTWGDRRLVAETQQLTHTLDPAAVVVTMAQLTALLIAA